MNRLNRQITSLAASLLAAALLAAPASALADRKHKDHRYGGYRHDHHCADWELRTRGGKAAVRFMHNRGHYKVVRHGVKRGRVCGPRALTVELGKIDPYTRVIFRINGERHVFDYRDRPDSYINHWYRKYVRVVLPHRGKHHHKYQDKHHYKHHDKHRGGYGDHYTHNGGRNGWHNGGRHDGRGGGHGKHGDHYRNDHYGYPYRHGYGYHGW